MDYKGQKLCEQIYYYLIAIAGAIAWVVGYVYQDFALTFYGWLGGVAVSLILCIPDWPMYNRNPVSWLDKLPDRPGYKKVGAQLDDEEEEEPAKPQAEASPAPAPAPSPATGGGKKKKSHNRTSGGR